MRILPPRHALKVLLSCLNGRNAPVKTVASDEHIAGIERQSLKVPSSMTDIVSFLQTGPPDGRRVIFIHGTPGNAKGWADYLLDVPAGRRHIAVDRLGYGFSQPKHAVVSLKRQAQAIVPLLKTINSRKAILVGHSSGASVALQTALDFPGTVGGLLLLAGAFDPDLEEASWLQPIGTLKPISRLLTRTINNANRELLGLKRELMAQADRLHKISIPVGVVHGDSDPLVPLANLNYLQRRLTNAWLDKKVLKRADHFIPWHSKPSIDAALKHLIEHVRRTE
jgi:pimeloyl-ACP methyl ester carboxylesterase